MDNKQTGSSKNNSQRGNGRDDRPRWLRFALGYILPGLLVVWMFQELVAPAFSRSRGAGGAGGAARGGPGVVVDGGGLSGQSDASRQAA